MSKTIIVGTNTLLQMAKQLHDQGEITTEQFQEMLDRDIPEHSRKDVVIKID